MSLNIRARILVLAIVPLVLVAALLTAINLRQASIMGTQSVSAFEQSLSATYGTQLDSYLSLARTVDGRQRHRRLG